MYPKTSAGLSYLIGIVGIIFFFIEKQNCFVKFNALQAIFLHFGARNCGVCIAHPLLYHLLLLLPLQVQGLQAPWYSCLVASWDL